MNGHLLLLINGWAGHDRSLDLAMIFCAKYLVYGVFAITLAWFLFSAYRREFRRPVWFVVNLGVTFVLLQIAEHIYPEQRPFVVYHLTQLLPHASNQSFPSDHTVVSSAIAFGFMVFTRFKKSGVVLFLVALLIGFARIFIGVHYPGDIVGAIAVAAVGVGISFYACKLWQRRFSPEQIV